LKTAIPHHFLDYIRHLPSEHRQTLTDLRELILQQLDEPDEVMRWNVPAFRYRDKLVAGIGAWRHHVGLYVMYGNALEELKKAAPDLDISERVLRIDPTRSIPSQAVKQAIRFRIAEIDSA
jgi:uncharacterized protein YdhG (YjbR/CyaY superfamily)